MEGRKDKEIKGKGRKEMEREGKEWILKQKEG